IFYFSILQENNSYEWAQTSNFHEGYRFNITGLEPSKEINTFTIIYGKKQYFRKHTNFDMFYIPDIDNLNEFVWISDHFRIPFVRIDTTIQDYVNSIVIAGNYTDEKGQTFIFTESGEAIWPDQTFKYNVSLDTMLSLFSWCDYFFLFQGKDIQSNRIKYPFKWEDNKLFIYGTYYLPNSVPNSDSLIPTKEPLYILTPQ
ncbi:hypothetical protein ACFL50_02725, partial [Candidatus Latescibacterota bacterium]